MGSRCMRADCLDPRADVNGGRLRLLTSFLHYAWGGRLCLHPFNLGTGPVASRRNQFPNLKLLLPVALRQSRKAHLKIAIGGRARSGQAKSRFKWQWRHACRLRLRTSHRPTRSGDSASVSVRGDTPPTSSRDYVRAVAALMTGAARCLGFAQAHFYSIAFRPDDSPQRFSTQCQREPAQVGR